MLIGARTAAWSGGGGWTNPYVTDGLLSLWEGQFGFIDKINGDELSVYGDVSSTKDGFVCNGGLYNDSYSRISQAINENGTATVQIVCDMQTVKSFIFYFFFGNSYPLGDNDSNKYKRFCLYAADGYYERWWFAQKIENVTGYKNALPIESKVASLSFVVNGNSATIFNSSKGASVSTQIAGSEDLTSGIYFATPERENVYFEGMIYSIRCYSTALSPEQIMFNYAVDHERFGV